LPKLIAEKFEGIRAGKQDIILIPDKGNDDQLWRGMTCPVVMDKETLSEEKSLSWRIAWAGNPCHYKAA
jgi:hypothetical protein